MATKRITAAAMAAALSLLCACGNPAGQKDEAAVCSTIPLPASSQAVETAVPISSQAETCEEPSAADSQIEDIPDTRPDEAVEIEQDIDSLVADEEAVHRYAEGSRLALIPDRREYPVGTKKITARFYNASDRSVSYAGDSQEYRLEKLVDGQWQLVPCNREAVLIPALAYSLQPYSRREKTYDLTIHQSQWMTAGQFRITEDDLISFDRRGYRDEHVERPTLTFYFSLYGEGNPFDPIMETASAYGDQFLTLPAGGLVLLAPEQRQYDRPAGGGYDITAFYYNQSDQPIDLQALAPFELEKKEADGWIQVPGKACTGTPESVNDIYEREGMHTVKSHHMFKIGFQLCDFEKSMLTAGDYRISLSPMDQEGSPFIFHFSLSEDFIPESDRGGVVSFSVK